MTFLADWSERSEPTVSSSPTLSHELRTPLARRRSMAQAPLDDPAATVESRRAAHERVLTAGAQGEQLIDALLTLARGQAGLDLRAELAPASSLGDPRLVEQPIANLVDNAIRHNRPDGSIRIVTDTSAGHAGLSVTNAGPVVPPDAVDRLVEPFQRLGTDRTSRSDGLGLGLSIVRAIATPTPPRSTWPAQREGGLQIEVTFPAAETSTLTEPVSASRAAVLRPTSPALTVPEGAAHVEQ